MPELEFIISTKEQHERLVSLLKKRIEEDCRVGREIIAKEQKAPPGQKKIPPKALSVLSENINARETILGELIKKLDAPFEKPITLKEFHEHYIQSVSRGTRDKPLYYALIFQQIRTDVLPPDALAHAKTVMAQRSPHQVMTTIPMGNMTRDDIETLPLRQKTLEYAADLAFNQFYLAATKREKVERIAPDYAPFTNQVNALLYGGYGISGINPAAPPR
jgi:hypothetical protein